MAINQPIQYMANIRYMPKVINIPSTLSKSSKENKNYNYCFIYLKERKEKKREKSECEHKVFIG